MKILHAVAPGDFGGLEDVVVRLCSGLRARGHEVIVTSVVNTAAPAGAFSRELQEGGVEVRPIVSARDYLRELREVRSLCERELPDVIHTHGYRPGVIYPIGVRSLEIPLVTTFHGFTGGDLKNRFYQWLQIRSARAYDAVVAVSEPMAVILRKRGIPKPILHVIPNAWRERRPAVSRTEARRELGVPEGFHVGWVGRMSREKGPDVFLEALALLPDSANVTVSMIGSGPLRSELERRASLMKTPGVRFHGTIKSASTLFPAFDLFVLSSRTEGTPIVLFEAMAAAVPIVATTVGGVPDVLDSDTGTLVEPDNPRALADAILGVKDDRSAAEQRADRARSVLTDRFSEEPWLSEYERIYDSLRHE